MRSFISQLLDMRRRQLSPKDDHNDTLFQTSTMAALMSGDYEGKTTIKDLSERGDFGLGIFNGVKAEMVACNGTFFKVNADGSTAIAKPEEMVPFSAMKFFKPDMQFELASVSSFTQLCNEIENKLGSPDAFYAIMVKGFFPSVTLQTAPLSELGRKQDAINCKDMHGILMGFRFPDFTDQLNVSGYHLHFLNDERTMGGHLMDAVLSEVSIQLDETTDLHLSLPEEESQPLRLSRRAASQTS